MFVTAIVFFIIGMLYLLFPHLAWIMGSYNTTALGSDIREENETINALARKRKLGLVRMSGVVFMLVGVSFYLLK